MQMTIRLIERLSQGSYQSLIFVWNRLGVLVCDGRSCSVEHCTWSRLLPCCRWWTPRRIHTAFTAETALNKPEEGSALPLQSVQHTSITESHLILESIRTLIVICTRSRSLTKGSAALVYFPAKSTVGLLNLLRRSFRRASPSLYSLIDCYQR